MPNAFVSEVLDVVEAAQSLQTLSTVTLAVRPVSRYQLRAPNSIEIANGIPMDFIIKEIPRLDGSRVDKYFIARSGKVLRSTRAVLRAFA
jgi:hypothetical protein